MRWSQKQLLMVSCNRAICSPNLEFVMVGGRLPWGQIWVTRESPPLYLPQLLLSSPIFLFLSFFSLNYKALIPSLRFSPVSSQTFNLVLELSCYSAYAIFLVKYLCRLISACRSAYQLSMMFIIIYENFIHEHIYIIFIFTYLFVNLYSYASCETTHFLKNEGVYTEDRKIFSNKGHIVDI